jgi:hypothetical protein
MTAPVGKPDVRTAPRKAVTDFDTRHRLGEVQQRGAEYLALNRRGEIIGTYASADAAIEAVRVAAGLGVP